MVGVQEHDFEPCRKMGGGGIRSTALKLLHEV
jgi:hypothetical protein